MADEPRDQLSPGRPSGADADALRLRMAEAWRLRIDEGLSLAKIAERLGCSERTVHRYIQATMTEHAPDPADVERYRAMLVDQAFTRTLVCLERADALHEEANTEPWSKSADKGTFVEEMGPKLQAAAGMWEQRAHTWAAQLARVAGVEAMLAAHTGPDPDSLEGEISAEAERYLQVVAEADRRRQAATVGANGATPASNGAQDHG